MLRPDVSISRCTHTTTAVLRISAAAAASVFWTMISQPQQVSLQASAAPYPNVANTAFTTNPLIRRRRIKHKRTRPNVSSPRTSGASTTTSTSSILQAVAPIPIPSSDWPDKFPAKEHCSKCGLCETSFVQHVTSSCAFLKQGMARIDSLERDVHGRSRLDRTSSSGSGSGNGDAKGVTRSNNNKEEENLETRFGVLHPEHPIWLAKGTQQNAQWTGVVTSIAIAMLERQMVDAVVCIASNSHDLQNKNDEETRSDENENFNDSPPSSSSFLEPKPILAKTVDEILLGRGVKPSLAPSLKVLDEIKQDPTIRKLLFCGVGCAVQAFRSPEVQMDLGLEKVYVLGTNCADNSPTPSATRDFIVSGLNVDEKEMSSVKGYEFMQDFQVHVKKQTMNDDSYSSTTTRTYYEKIPYFSLPGKIARSSIASSCLSCFDYTNALADVVVGYMGAPLDADGAMDKALQTLTVRNGMGKEMVDVAIQAGRLKLYGEAPGKGPWQEFAVQTVSSDGIVAGMVGKQPKEAGMPRFVGKIMAKIITEVGPKGLNFAAYSIDYHILRNYLYVLDQWGEERAEAMMPQYSRNIVADYLSASKTFQELKDSIVAKKKKLHTSTTQER